MLNVMLNFCNCREILTFGCFLILIALWLIFKLSAANVCAKMYMQPNLKLSVSIPVSVLLWCILLMHVILTEIKQGRLLHECFWLLKLSWLWVSACLVLLHVRRACCVAFGWSCRSWKFVDAAFPALPAVDDCTVDKFRCNSGKCIARALVCNGRRDCTDNSDERNCRKSTVPPSVLLHWAQHC